MSTEAVRWSVSLSDIDFGLDEENAVLAVLRSKWLTAGERTATFEQRFAAHVGAKHGIALHSCTAALHLGLLAVGVGQGDEVIVPALTFVATANAVLYCGAVPVFADIEGERSLLMSPEDVERKITPRTRAVVPMHYAGYACDMDRLGALARARGLRVVEDAAHAPGSRWRGRPVGSLSEASCFSFFSNKNLVTGEGGMLTTDDDAIATLVRRGRSHGMTAVSYDRHKGHAFGYDVVQTGYNYRPTEMQSALGLVQLDKLDANNARRRSLVAAYRRRLAAIAGVLVPFEGRDGESSCHICPILLPPGTSRAEIQRAMRARGIQTSIHYPPIHRFTSFSGRFSADVPALDRVAERLLTLPLHPLMGDREVALVCDALEAAL
jgi:dTDP-4-amino-4,6-dideoxygalactose transaminase